MPTQPQSLFEVSSAEHADAMAHRTLKGGKKNKSVHDIGESRTQTEQTAAAARNTAARKRGRQRNKQQTLADILRKIKLSNLRLDPNQTDQEKLRRIRQHLVDDQRGFNLDAALQSASITEAELIDYLRQNHVLAEYLFEILPYAESEAEFGEWLRKTARAMGMAAGIGLATIPNPHAQNLGKAIATAISRRTDEGDEARRRAQQLRIKDRGGAGPSKP